MIYIIEIPHQGAPECWSRESREDVMSAIATRHASEGFVYEALTGEELLEEHGASTTDELRTEYPEHGYVAVLIEAHGTEVTLYKSLHSIYGIEPIDPWEAHLAANAEDLHAQRVYESDTEARAALADDAEWPVHQGRRARAALRQEMEGGITQRGNAHARCEL